MSEEKKEGTCCSSQGGGCGCGKGLKLLLMLLIGVFIFFSGMWFAKANCHSCHMGGYCPFSSPAQK